MSVHINAIRARLLSRHFLIIIFDLLASGVAFISGYLTIIGYPVILDVPYIINQIVYFIIVANFIFLLFKPYRGSWRYVSIPDLQLIMVSAGVTISAYIAGMFLLTRGENIPRSVVVLSFIYLVLIMAGARLAYRIMVERIVQFPSLAGGVRRQTSLVLLCGSSDKAESFIRTTRRDSNSQFSVVGIIDDSRANLGRTIQGVKVLGTLGTLDVVIAKLKSRGLEINEVVVAEATMTKARLRKIFDCANSLSLKVSRIPDLDEIADLTGNLLVEPKPVELEDLLERPEVKPNASDTLRLIEGKVVLITGAGGSIGSELCRQIATFIPRQLIITDHSEFHLYKLDKELREKYPDAEIISLVVDVRDRVRVSHVLARFVPEVIFHAAALKHVPLMEENPLEAVKTNVLGTRNVADAALEHRAATFIMISTDKAVNPTSIMGATKRAAEAYCQSLDVMSEYTRFKTVRFGNVLGSNGSVVPRFQEQIASGGPVTVTHPEIVRYFMTIPEAVTLLLQASAHAHHGQDERGKIMVLDMGKPVRIVDLATRLIQLAGYRPWVDIDIVFTGLRPGEKLYEELFDAKEMPERHTEECYVVASSRTVDSRLVEKTMQEMESCLLWEDTIRTIELLAHIVPEYRKEHLSSASTIAAVIEKESKTSSISTIDIYHKY